MPTKRRPRRGPAGPNVIVTGDTGTYGGPQGGARLGTDVYMESGDLESREFGVPQADIPGGKTHVVNPETHHDKPPGVPQRGADYHKYHGVESDDGPYETPSPEVGPPGPISPVPKDAYKDAVPVVIVEDPERPHVIRRAFIESITLTAQTAAGFEPTRICGRDDHRDEIMLLCTDASNDALFASDIATLLEGRGAKLPKAATSYTRVATQDFLYGMSSSASTTAALSVIIISETAIG